MDQAEHKEILRMIKSVTNFLDFRILRLMDNQGSLFECAGVVLLGVHAGVDALLGLCELELQFWELQLHCCMCCYFTSLDHLAGSCFPELPLCCWVWVVMVMVEVELGAWLFVGLSMLCTWIAISILKNLAFSGLNLGWLSCSSWWAPSPGCWLVWCGWGSAWGVGSVGLCWQRNRVCLNVVSHLVICHPSILVVY